MLRNAITAALLGAAAGAVLATAVLSAETPPSATAVLSAETPAPATAVGIDNFTFNPQKLTVKTGTTVKWTNRDDIPHTVAAVNKEFRSKALDTDDEYSFTFTTPGSYEYFCSIHPHMTATIVVEAATGNAAAR